MTNPYEKQNILIIGGSRFVGPLLIQKLLSKGNKITIFNRGKIKSEYNKKVKFIRGDRNKDFSSIKNAYDIVIDMCSYNGSQTKKALNELNFDFFIHFSSAAVYKKPHALPLTELSPIGDWPLWSDYNKGKVECEEVLAKSGIKYASLRPVYVLGQKNYCDREHFIYSRIKNNEPFILPGNGEAKIQFVFAEEVAESIALIAEKRLIGAFNCAGDETATLVDLVKTMGKIVGREPILQFNPSADGENFDISEFPFANENLVVSNDKIKDLGVNFAPLFESLKWDYESHYYYQA